MEYTGKVFIPNYDEAGKYAGWKSIEDVTVEADSLKEAISQISKQSIDRFRCSFIHLDSIVSEGKRVYQTAWDELGPLVSFEHPGSSFSLHINL